MSDGVNVYELLYLARSADEHAFAMLIEQFKPLFYKTYKELRAHYGRVDYDELYDAMITGLYNAVTHYREDKNTAFTSFATLCITREMKNYIRINEQKNPYRLLLSLDDYMRDVEELKYGDMVLRDDSNNPHNIMRANSLIEEIDRVLGDSLERKIFHLRIEGFTYVEIAKELGIKKKDVDNSLQRIRKKIAYLFD